MHNSWTLNLENPWGPRKFLHFLGFTYSTIKWTRCILYMRVHKKWQQNVLQCNGHYKSEYTFQYILLIIIVMSTLLRKQWKLRAVLVLWQWCAFFDTKAIKFLFGLYSLTHMTTVVVEWLLLIIVADYHRRCNVCTEYQDYLHPFDCTLHCTYKEVEVYNGFHNLLSNSCRVC